MCFDFMVCGCVQCDGARYRVYGKQCGICATQTIGERVRCVRIRGGYGVDDCGGCGIFGYVGRDPGGEDGVFVDVGYVEGDGLCGRQGSAVGGCYVEAVACLCLKVCGCIQCDGTRGCMDGKGCGITTTQAVA